MINVQSCGRHFDWLIGYLLGQERATEQERVAWTATRNLPTDDPTLATTFMRATAAQSQLVQKPVYQIVLSFAPDDPVDRALMERVADRVLQRVGLGEHQAILVAHCDRPHPHVHVIVNRVHPETGRVWSTWEDWRRVRQVVSQEELALGLRHVPSRLLQVDALAQDLRTYDRVVELTRERYRAETEANAASARATRWQLELESARNAGAHCERALGRVYRDPGHAYQAYRAVADRDGVNAATRCLRERPEEFGALVAVKRRRALGLVHTADDSEARSAASAAAVAARAALEAAERWRQAAALEAQRVEQAFDRELDLIYEEPRAARAAFERLAAERGGEQAGATLREQPGALGAVRSSPGPAVRSFEQQAARTAACGVEAVQAHALANAADPLGPESGRAAARTLPRGEVDRAAAQLGAIRAELRGLPQRAALTRRIANGLNRLWPREVRLLQKAVTAPQFAVAMQLRAAIRDVVLDRDDERDE